MAFRWVRGALCAGAIVACGGEIRQENQSVPPEHPGGVQDDGLPGQGAAGPATGAGEVRSGAGGGRASGESAGPSSAGGAFDTGGSGSDADAAVNVVDTRHDERERLVEQYCAACGRNSDCVPQMITELFTWITDACWDEWIASMNCSTANACAPLMGGVIGGGACLAERTAFENCDIRNRMAGDVTGSTGTCSWERPASGTNCHVGCDDLLHFYDTDCDGPPGGPFKCMCRLNGVELADSLVENGTLFYVNTCEEAA